MNVLAFDTCFGALSVAVRWQTARGEWLLRESYEEIDRGHAERLMPAIAAVIDGAGLGYDRIDRIAVSTGPGSFTGLRIGIAAARGLALAMAKPVVGMSSLAVIAERADLLLRALRAGRDIVVAMDARKGGLYVQAFAATAGDAASPPELLAIDAAAEKYGGSDAIAVGTGAQALAAAAGTGARLCVALPKLQPHARGLALLGHMLPVLSPVTPLYLRPVDAKPQSAAVLPRG